MITEAPWALADEVAAQYRASAPTPVYIGRGLFSFKRDSRCQDFDDCCCWDGYSFEGFRKDAQAFLDHFDVEWNPEVRL